MSPQDTLLGGRYRLETVIGRGGMAEVWRARDERLGRPVAVKRLRVDLASDPTFLARFRREAQSSAGLNHPNIVATYDTGEAPATGFDVDVPYIVMELVQGHTLRDVLRDGRKILPERALEFVQGVLDALAYSHRNGIVHRDIKPANVMLTGTGQVKVMDFGIARAVADTSATMTQTAAVIGTAQYLSPEQARGETVDQRSDIYSAGCLLYELLVGRPPFVGDSPVSVAYQHVREQPVPPSSLDSEITPAMDAITLKALAKDPDERYQDAREMRDDIARLLAGREVTAVLPPAAVVVPEPAPTSIVPAMSEVTGTGQISAVTSTQTAVDEPRRRGAGTYVLVTLLALLLVALGFGAYQVLKPEKKPTVAMATVPRVTGVTEEAAKNTILNYKLTVGKITYINGEDKSKGTVVKQSPEGSTEVPEQTPVELWVNIGVATAKIPEGLVGKQEAEVTAALTALKFTVKSTPATEEPVDFVKGQVTEVKPAAGADHPVGGEVEILVATGMSKVPDVAGKTEAEATEILTKAGFKVERKDVDGGTKGQVASTDPAKDTKVKRGDPVTINVSKGEPELPKIPGDLVGKQESEVTQALKAAGFEVKVVPAPQPEPIQATKGQVLDVDPPSGQQVEAGSTVTITVASGNSIVPNLRGKTVEEATKIVQELGFGLDVTEVETTQAEPGTVFRQEPTDGGPLTRGKAIKVTVAKAPAEDDPSSSPSE